MREAELVVVVDSEVVGGRDQVADDDAARPFSLVSVAVIGDQRAPRPAALDLARRAGAAFVCRSATSAGASRHEFPDRQDKGPASAQHIRDLDFAADVQNQILALETVLLRPEPQWLNRVGQVDRTSRRLCAAEGRP
jgi:hypothetical protein